MKNVEDIYQLSPVQEAVLASRRLGQMSGTLSGALDIRALEWAWQQVLNRHSILRTSFVWKRLDKPLQVVNRELSIALQIHEAVSEEDLSKLRREELAKEIDPSVAPLARVVVCRTSADSAHLILTYHPLILDERSVSLLLQEVLAYYASAGNGRSPQLASSSSFWAYVSWVKEQDLAGAESFWRESLRDFKGQTPLAEVYPPCDLANDLTNAGVGYDQAVTEILRDSFEALAALADRLQVRLETLMHGAWALLLHRETGDEDLIYGYAETPGNLAGNVLGPLSTTLPVRVRIDAHSPASSWIKSLETQFNEIRSYAFYNVNELPLLQSVVLDHRDDYIEVQGSSLKVVNVETVGPVNVPIIVNLPNATAPQLRIRYDRTLFARETIQIISAHFQTLLTGLIANPEQPVLNLPFLTTAEEEQLSGWNQTATTYPRESCVHRLFEQQVDERPQDIAVVFEDEQLTYAELNERANQLAHHLRLLGVQPETRIALCVERSLEMLVGILGILKAGGAYAPLDPSHPLERLSFMLEDLQAPVVLTQEHLLDKLPAHWGQVVCVDADWDTISLQSTENPINEATAENLAYVMYTSGSTGTPKGVSVSHRAVVRLVQNTNYVRLGPDEVFLQFAPISFDASTLEIWGCLLNGGRLVVMPPSLASLDVLGENLRNHGVTTLWLTAGLFHLMVDERLDDLQPVRQLLAGGDALSVPHVRKAFQGLPSCQLINGYGPTEGTTFTCCCPVRDMTQLRTSVPIGRPIANTQAFILDRHLRPVSVGVVGELYIGGDGLARDYHNRPDLTAERFVPSTQGDVPGARLYKTGDLVRYLPDGNIEFLGRRDLQVKIRGFRIEVGEVETALSTHPALQDAVVVARADIAGEKQLVAYLVTIDGKSVEADELRDFLRQKLPEHMVPAAFVSLEAFPLTANGKVDRRALPAPDADRRGLAQDFVAPRTEIEDLLAVIWSQVLGVDQVGIDDNFFSLGGDSIRSVQVLARVQQRGLSLSLQDLFQYQTIRELAKIAAVDSAGRPEPTQPFSLISDQDRQKLPPDVEDAYPLTMLQAGMIFHTELNPEAGIYHDIFSHHVRAPYNPDALHAALESLVQRHAVLRTCFVLQGFSEPLQLVRRAVEIPLEVADLRELSPSEQDYFVRNRVETLKNRGFDWSHAPLINIEFYRRANDTVQLTLSFHHAILDGWSLASMVAELFQLYFSFIDQEGKAEAAPLVGSYRDYVAMELKALRSEACRDYWTDKLRGSSPAHLPHESAADDHQDSDAQVHSIEVGISAELSLRLKDLARSVSVPIKSVLLAAHLKVMSFISGESDITTGLVSNGRPEEGDGERLLGLFLNTIPFRQQFSSGSWIDLVQQTFQNEWEALPFRWYPLAQMQRQQGSQSLFETAFNFVHFHVAAQLQARGNIELLDSITFVRTNFPLVANFNLDLGSSDVRLQLVTDGASLTKKQTEAIADYYVRALTAMATEPESHHESTSLLSHEERQRLLVEWNDTATEYPSELTLSQLFEAQVERTPDAMAVGGADLDLTYGELNGRVNQLARHLVKLGVGPEQLVGVCMERSTEMVIALLGVLKAGGAYVPLDPAYPKDRLAFMVEDARVRVIVAQEKMLESLPEYAAELVCLDTDWERISLEPTSNVETETTPDNSAYVIYTSGSTGKPKGVVVTHRNVVRLFASTEDYFNFGEQDVWTLFHSYAFDFSVWELWGALLYGGKVVGVPYWVSRSPEAFYQLLKDEGVTVLNQTPSAFRQLIEVDRIETSELSLRLIIFGGEALELNSLRPWFERHGDERPQLVNMYGITETTVHVTYRPLQIADVGSQSVIGRALPDLRVCVLDEHLCLVPPGVTGEMYVGGAGLGRGYLNRSELTAERFIPDPFSTQAGERLYKTGDLARFSESGELEYLGRGDNQVKIRGFRIELGEIEARLLEHPDISEAVVVARQEKDDQRIVAYLVARGEPRPESLRVYLRETLPDYMVPSAFVLLDEMPLTPNGKVDRRALPAPGEESLAVSSAEMVAPRSEIEQLLHSIWAAVLKLESFGIHDNFFALGGHSLLATQVVTRVREALQVAMPLRQLFTHPTVAELGHWVQTALRDESTQVPPLERVPRIRPLPLSFAQQRLWFIDQLQPGSAVYNIPLAMRLHGALDVPVLERAINEIVRRHEVLRTTFELIDGEPVQVIGAPESLRVEVTDLSQLAAEEREPAAMELANAEARAPFDLACGPLLRVRLLRLKEDEHLALLTMHHVISDGWSMDVLLREVTTLYGAFSRDESSPLPELEIQYGDYAVWQREWLQGEELERQAGYWRKQLQGAPAVLELPQDHPRPPVQTHQGATHKFVLEPELSSRVRELGRETGMTTFMVLLAAWQVLLKRLSGTDDVSVGTVVAGRTHPQVEPLIGFFVNTLVLRAQMSGDPTFAELLEQVREVCLEAYSHQDVPFEKLVEELAPERSMAHAPLFQVLMLMLQQQQHERTVPVADLTISGVEAEGTSAKYDLTMYLHEGREVISGGLEYNTDIFEAERAQRMVEQWQRVLAAAVADPQRRISELPLMSDEERQQLLVEWNDTAAEYPSELTLPQLFEAQVERTPEAVALISDEERISYAELNRRANQLAHHLVQLGVGPEQLVGVCVERSINMVVALLATLKTGAAYLPLDLQYPWARLHFMIEDAGVNVLLTQQQHKQRFAGDNLEIVCLDTDRERLATAATAATLEATNPSSPASARNLAYVIYTSGSTGQPKGVAIEHRNASALIAWAISAFSPAELSGVLASTSISFDLSIFELFVPLACGGTVILAENALHLPQLPAASEVTLINTVPSAMTELVRMQAVPESVRTVNLAGEPLPKLLVQSIYAERDTVERVCNLYGPSEDTTYSTWTAITRGASGQPTIGRPVTNGEVYILDAQQQPVPVSVTGELYVGGEGVARGYLNRPALTSERFVPHPFSEKPGARLYRTGDLARYLPNGEIEFLGRIDHQVKIRGFRIELGEIESVLNQHPRVTAAAVVRQDGIEPRLAAYVVSDDTGLTTAELRLFTKDRLPDPMVPSVFILMDQLPLTANGKVDRRALQERRQDVPVAAETLVAPRDVVELQLAQIWENILRVKSISVRDNFFELGGHSFLAIRLMAAIKEQTGQSLPLALLIQQGTIEALATELRKQQTARFTSPLIAIRRDGAAPPFFCVHPAGGNVLCYAPLAKHLGPERPFYAFQARGLEDGEESVTSVEAAAFNYVEAMRAVQPEGPYFIGGWSIGGLIAFEMSRMLQAQGQQIALLALFDSHLVHEKQVEEDEATLLIGAALHMGLPPEHIPSLRQSLIALEPEARLEFAMSYIRGLNLLPPGLDEAQARKLIAVFKANLHAARNYFPQPADVKVTFFKANDPREASTIDPVAAWNTLARKGVAVHEVFADHFAMMREPHVTVLAELLSHRLHKLHTLSA